MSTTTLCNECDVLRKRVETLEAELQKSRVVSVEFCSQKNSLADTLNRSERRTKWLIVALRDLLSQYERLTSQSDQVTRNAQAALASAKLPLRECHPEETTEEEILVRQAGGEMVSL